jgi:hypothetical protein
MELKKLNHGHSLHKGLTKIAYNTKLNIKKYLVFYD